jgi:PEP-CTERM motif
MRCVVFATVFPIMLIAFAHPGEAGPITYTIQNYPADQNGATLSGSITTDGVIGNLAGTDILSWSWTITPSGGTPFTFSSSEAGAETFLQGTLVASASTITMPATGFANDGENNLDLGTSDNATLLGYARENTNGGVLGVYDGRISSGNVWSTVDPAMGGTDPWVIAVAGAAVPEPSSVLLLTLGTAGVLLSRGTLWRSRRKRRREASTCSAPPPQP